jgi:glycosyltransferase involved in cell wall biosynthesis
MRVGLFHNRYTERGGEDVAFEREAEALCKAGCEVHAFEVDSAGASGLAGRARAAVSARGSAAMARRAREFAERHRIEVAHVHNFFPLLTPAVHRALFDLGVPVVQTLHNYRLACARADFLREGRPCEDCVERGPWNAVRHGCWRGSRLATAVWADAVSHHRRRGTWLECVARFVAPSRFAAEKLVVAAGIARERTTVIPDPVEDPGAPVSSGRGAVYVGRLAPEKGVRLLLEAWRRLGSAPLSIVGGGPDEPAVRALAAALPNVRVTGALPAEGVRAELASAAFGVFPSLCYETFGLAAAEALAAGRPVVVPGHGALAELASGGRSGVCFSAGDADALAAACRGLLDDPERCESLGREARAVFDDALAPDARVARLLSLYHSLLKSY